MSGARIWYRNMFGKPIGDISVIEDVRTTLAAIEEAKRNGKPHAILTKGWCGKPWGDVAVPVEGVWEITSSK